MEFEVLHQGLDYLAHLSEWLTELLSTTSYYLNREQLLAGLSTLQDSGSLVWVADRVKYYWIKNNFQQGYLL